MIMEITTQSMLVMGMLMNIGFLVYKRKEKERLKDFDPMDLTNVDKIPRCVVCKRKH